MTTNKDREHNVERDVNYNQNSVDTRRPRSSGINLQEFAATKRNSPLTTVAGGIDVNNINNKNTTNFPQKSSPLMLVSQPTCKSSPIAYDDDNGHKTGGGESSEENHLEEVHDDDLELITMPNTTSNNVFNNNSSNNNSSSDNNSCSNSNSSSTRKRGALSPGPTSPPPLGFLNTRLHNTSPSLGGQGLGRRMCSPTSPPLHYRGAMDRGAMIGGLSACSLQSNNMNTILQNLSPPPNKRNNHQNLQRNQR